MSFSNEKKEDIRDYGWKLKAPLLRKNQMHKATCYIILSTQNSRQGKAIVTDNRLVMTSVAVQRVLEQNFGRDKMFYILTKGLSIKVYNAT